MTLERTVQSKSALSIAALSAFQLLNFVAAVVFLSKYRARTGDGECENLEADGDSSLLQSAQDLSSIFLVVGVLKETVKCMATLSLTLPSSPFHDPEYFQSLRTSPILWLLMLASEPSRNLAVHCDDEDHHTMLHLAIDFLLSDVPQLLIASMFAAATGSSPCSAVHSSDTCSTGMFRDFRNGCQTPACSGGCGAGTSGWDGAMVFSLIVTAGSLLAKVRDVRRAAMAGKGGVTPALLRVTAYEAFCGDSDLSGEDGRRGREKREIKDSEGRGEEEMEEMEEMEEVPIDWWGDSERSEEGGEAAGRAGLRFEERPRGKPPKGKAKAKAKAKTVQRTESGSGEQLMEDVEASDLV